MHVMGDEKRRTVKVEQEYINITFQDIIYACKLSIMRTGLFVNMNIKTTEATVKRKKEHSSNSDVKEDQEALRLTLWSSVPNGTSKDGPRVGEGGRRWLGSDTRGLAGRGGRVGGGEGVVVEVNLALPRFAVGANTLLKGTFAMGRGWGRGACVLGTRKEEGLWKELTPTGAGAGGGLGESWACLLAVGRGLGAWVERERGREVAVGRPLVRLGRDARGGGLVVGRGELVAGRWVVIAG